MGWHTIARASFLRIVLLSYIVNDEDMMKVLLV
jgi:hypothetical protein